MRSFTERACEHQIKLALVKFSTADHDRFQVNEYYSYEDEDDIFERPPFAVQFSTDCVQGVKDLTLIGVHTQPSNAVKG